MLDGFVLVAGIDRSHDGPKATEHLTDYSRYLLALPAKFDCLYPRALNADLHQSVDISNS